MSNLSSAPKKILVRSPNWIGDQILAYPFFHYLRKAYPKAEITAVCVPWVSDVQFHGYVDEVVVLERPSAGSFWSKFKQLDSQAKAIRDRGPWDLSISLPNSFSSAWLLKRAGGVRRRGYKFEGRGFLLNEGLKLPDETFEIHHRAQAYVDLLPDEARPDVSVKEFWGILPENELDDPIPGELEKFDYKLHWTSKRESEPLEKPKELYWVLAPGATADSRRWPIEYFIQLAQRVAKQTTLKGLIVGGPKEAPIAERLCQFEELNLLDYTARGNVSALAPIFENAEFTVTNESGLAHVAALCGSLVQIVCGAADPRRTRPVGPGLVQVSLNAVECWPCERNTCSQPMEKTIQCLKGIKPETVWEEIKRGLRKVSS